MTHQINLDALIPREDFEVEDRSSHSSPTATLQIRNLESNDFFYSVIRKPDFQRETSDWTAPKICDFIQSFLDGDLIPAVILWQAGNHIFVIDGAHRMSALIAWVHDDYGDGATSRKFFDGIIPDEQIAAAEHTRKLVKKQIGSYFDHQFAVGNPEKSKSEVVERAKRLGRLAIQLQWVQGDASKAEASFFKINQQATPIDSTELRLLKSRKLPNALAARAIVRSGTGHKYWSSFGESRRLEIEGIAKGINELLFTPSLKAPIKTLDLPVAGKGYSAQTLPLVFEYVNLVNGVKADSTPLEDAAGDLTLSMLKACKRFIDRISGTHPSSLGLHPVVYFYSATGRYQPTAFLAVVAMIGEMEKHNRFKEFTSIRQKYEDFLISHKLLVNQVTIKYGSGPKGYARLKQLLMFLMDQLLIGKTENDIITAMSSSPDFSFLQPSEKEQIGIGKDFSKDAKSAVFLRDALKEPLRCGICKGLIHKNAISIDHITRRAEGGTGALDNGQLTHPYCNTTIKN